MIGLQAHRLWSTNILIRQLGDLESCNEELAGLARDIHNRKVDHSENYLNNQRTAFQLSESPSVAVKSLYRQIHDTLEIYIRDFYPSVSFDNLEVQVSTYVNVQTKSNRWFFPHRHVPNQLVATYYPKVFLGPEEGADGGALCFHDSRPVLPNWMLRTEPSLKVCNLITGSLIMFPGFAEHSTIPMFDDRSEKVAIITNIKFFRTGEVNPWDGIDLKELL